MQGVLYGSDAVKRFVVEIMSGIIGNEFPYEGVKTVTQPFSGALSFVSHSC